MNLVKEPWIPVVMQDGKPARVSLGMRLQKGRTLPIWPQTHASVSR